MCRDSEKGEWRRRACSVLSFREGFNILKNDILSLSVSWTGTYIGLELYLLEDDLEYVFLLTLTQSASLCFVTCLLPSCAFKSF